MKRIEQSGPFYAAYYLIEADGEYETAITDYLTRMHQDGSHSHIHDAFKYEDLMNGHRIKGNRESGAHPYPFILTINRDVEYGCLIVNFVPKIWFDEDASTNASQGTLQSLCDQLFSAATMKPWLDRLIQAAHEGVSSVTFRDVDDEPNTCDHALNNSQAEWLRQHGWSLNWEKYPREWIVSGWF